MKCRKLIHERGVPGLPIYIAVLPNVISFINIRQLVQFIVIGRCIDELLYNILITYLLFKNINI